MINTSYDKANGMFGIFEIAQWSFEAGCHVFSFPMVIVYRQRLQCFDLYQHRIYSTSYKKCLQL